jgi:subtilisin family serine protease
MNYLKMITFACLFGASEAMALTSLPGEIVYLLKDNTIAVDEQNFLLRNLEQRLGSNSVLSIKALVTDARVGVIKIKQLKDFDRALTIVQENSEVEFAEPNFLYHTVVEQPSAELGTGALGEGVPNDVEFKRLWGLNNIGQKDTNGDSGILGMDINVLPLWKQGFYGSRDIVVAVIDTGFDWTHPDLADNLYTNPGESGPKATNGKDDDGNGFIDDVHGWNFITNTNNSVDDEGHGSHCAGTIGGVGNNEIGIAGVNWKVSIMPVKFIGSNGSGSLSNAIEALNYARKMNVRITSNSWGSLNNSKILKKAVQAVSDSGILFVAAAGNDKSNNDQNGFYPASYPMANVLSVAAINGQGKIASFSNFGLLSVHVAAPGVEIYSTSKEGGYNRLSGTSMATPHVAGLAALLVSVNPKWTATELKNRLIKSSRRSYKLAPIVMAKGSVDAFNALNGIYQPPDPSESEWKTKTYKLESPHPYEDAKNLKFEIRVPGAKKVRVHFSKIYTEQTRDRVILRQPDGEVVAELSGQITDFTTDYGVGDTIQIELDVDKTVHYDGFYIDRVQYIQ